MKWYGQILRQRQQLVGEYTNLKRDVESLVPAARGQRVGKQGRTEGTGGRKAFSLRHSSRQHTGSKLQ